VLLTGLAVLAMFLRWRGTLFRQRWLMWVFVVAVLGPFVCNQSGWVAAEVGRQPFIVYPEIEWKDDETPVMKTQGPKPGLRTAEALSSETAVGADQIVQSIVMFSFVYLLLFVVWVYVLNGKIHHGPDEVDAIPTTTTPGGLLEAAAANKPAGGESLTRVHDPDDEKGGV
jgi:cytochrome d ubiquinol oxidase subunit I